ncbi:MAG: AI-2E family transporter [Oscillospiraceae bacterium]|jgi:predicted PurR-regulated permease PerM
MELNKSNMKKILFLIAFGISFYMALKNLYLLPYLFNVFFSVAGPVLAGFAAAFVLNIILVPVETRLFAPLNRRYKKIWPKIRRAVGILVSLVIVFGLIALVLLIVIPELVRTITNLANNIQPFFNELQNSFTKIDTKYPDIAKYFQDLDINWTNISQMIAEYSKKFASSLVGSTVSVTAMVFHGAISFVLSFVIAVNVLAQKERLYHDFKKVSYAYLPQKYADAMYYIFHLTNRAFYNFIAGTCTEACILGTLCFVGMNLFHFPYPLLISVFVAFMALIPILGAFFSTVVGAILISIVSPIQAVWFIIFFVVLQQLEGNLIYPRVVGSRVGLPALWVLVAVTIGGNAFGILGMLINIPICSVLYTLLRENVDKRKAPQQVTKEEKQQQA